MIKVLSVSFWNKYQSLHEAKTDLARTETITNKLALRRLSKIEATFESIVCLN